MAIQATVSGYTNIGHDLQLTLTGPDGVAITLTNIMSFEWRQITTDITHQRMDGTTLVADIPKAWEGTIEIHRSHGDIEEAFSAIQTAWLNNTDYVLGTMVFNVANEGAYTFLDVSLKLEDGGTWRGDEVTRQRIAFRAARLI